MGYTANDIRNICLLGHGGDGKSALCESMLFTTKAITRLGKRADGTTVSDFDDEEKKRQYSISSSVIPVEYNKCKLNVIDNPGYFDFAGQIVQSLRVVDAGLICLTAKSGIGVGTEKGWKYLTKAGLPAMFYVSKLDEEHANFFNVLDSLREMFGASVIPFTFPIMQGETAVGLVDLIEKKAYDANGKEIALPADANDRIEEYMAELNEQVAETDEALMEKFFMEEPFTAEELQTGIKAGIRDRSVTPVFCGCAYTGLGTTNLMANIVKYAPNPLEGKPMTKVDDEGGESEFKLNPNGSPMAFVFNTLADQYGKNSYFKVISGDMEDTLTVTNVRTGDSEKLGNMFFPKGKDNTKTSRSAAATSASSRSLPPSRPATPSACRARPFASRA
ncbi:MAG: GTP-binding protein [Oscillospiraceae bacterium]